MQVKALGTRTQDTRSRQLLAAARPGARGLAALAIAAACSATAFAQLDPLLFIKRVPPTVIVAIDTSMRMLEDGAGNYYDPVFYQVADDLPVSGALGINAGATYRRRYVNLQYEVVVDAATKFEAADIVATPMVWDPSNPMTSNAPADVAYMAPTRIEMAKSGIKKAVRENAMSTNRWGLVKMRQSGQAWRTAPDCDKPVRVTGNPVLATLTDSNPCIAGAVGSYGIYMPSVAAPSYSLAAAPNGTVVVGAAANTANAIVSVLNRPVLEPTGLIPASQGTRTYNDRPLYYLLEDAKEQAQAAMAADNATYRSRRNTVIVLVAGGKDDGDPTYVAGHDIASFASTFLSVSGGGVTKRVPIYVVGVRPDAADEAQLRQIATNSGGYYYRADSPSAVTAMVNTAVQAGFSHAGDFDLGHRSEYLPVSPIVGTVNLKNANDRNGAALPDTNIQSAAGQPIPQRSNMLLTSGFALPGFDARVRAFRTYKPVADATTASGWKFVSDGTPLWPDLDGRPSLAGLARAPANSADRNIYTFLPDAAGGGQVVAFSTDNAGLLQPHLGGVTDVDGLIGFVRGRAIGAIIGSTPAIMDPPSLDPPPDDDYGRSDAAGTFAGLYKDRRAVIFFGANDGMIHCVDARTGYEVWAFIPYNLLPKLRTLADGQPVEQFDYFVDSSPKIAELKVDGSWRSYLFIGQGPGGVFYQAFDVTGAGMGVSPELGDLGAASSLLDQFDAPNESIVFKWAFPNYSSFDPTTYQEITLAEGTAGNVLKLYGDLKNTATPAEKSVGFTWSDPAVGPLDATRTVNALIVGSGYFPPVEDLIATRGNSAPRAGRSLYLIDVRTGRLVGNDAGGACLGTGCLDVGDIANSRKNAIQADPSAAGESGSYVVVKAYVGDLDGTYWKFTFNDTGAIAADQMVFTDQPIYASSALLFVGTADVYMFFATGSDLLPVMAGGGTGTYRLIGLKDNAPGGGSTTKFTVDLQAVSDNGGYAQGEQPSTSPTVAGDVVFYTTIVTAADGTVTSNLYALSFLGGAAYDSSGNDVIDNNESPIVRSVAGRASAPFIVDQHLYFASAGSMGVNLEMFGDPEDFNNGVGQVGVRILSWREIR